jgi:hypothetical protein
VGGWMGPTAGLDAQARRKSSAPVGNRTPVIQSIVRKDPIYYHIIPGEMIESQNVKHKSVLITRALYISAAEKIINMKKRIKK